MASCDRHTKFLSLSKIESGRNVTHECEVCSGYNQHVLHELYTTSSSRWSRNTPSEGNRIPLNAERVSRTENTFKKTNGTDTLPGSNCFCKIPSVCQHLPSAINTCLAESTFVLTLGCRRKPNTAKVRRSCRSEGDQKSNKIATVMNNIHQFKIPVNRLNRSRSAQEINKRVSDDVRAENKPKTAKTKEAKDFNK